MNGDDNNQNGQAAEEEFKEELEDTKEHIAYRTVEEDEIRQIVKNLIESEVCVNSEMEEIVHHEIEVKEEAESGPGLTVLSVESAVETSVTLKEDVGDMDSEAEIENSTSSESEYLMEGQTNNLENDIRAVFDSDTDDDE